MKKLLMGVMVLTLIITSCNKYSNDFQALKDQISALSLKVDGVVALQSQLTATTAQITALQAAVAALPNNTAAIAALGTALGTTNDKITAINTALADLALKGATKESLDQLALDLKAALATANAANAAKIDSMITKLNGVDANATSNTAALQASINALKLLLADQDAKLEILLASSAMYNGDVTITTDTETAFYLGKVNQMGIINGNLTVNTAAITLPMDSVNKILAHIVGVIGKTTTLTINAGHNHWGNNLFVTTTTTGNSVTIWNTTGDGLKLPLLTSVAGNFTVEGNVNAWGEVVAWPSIFSVGGDVNLWYTGDYASATLASVGENLILHNMISAPSATPVVLGTNDILFPKVTVGGRVNNGTAPINGTVLFNSPTTTTINFGLSSTPVINTLTTKFASTVIIGNITPAGLTINADSASVVDLSKATTSTGGISVTTKKQTALNLSALTASAGPIVANLWGPTPSSTPLFVTNSGSVDLSAFNGATGVTINGPVTVDKLGSWYGAAGSMLWSQTATTVTLPHYQWLAGTVPTLPAVKWLTLGGAADVVGLTPYTTLLTANITGTVKKAGSPDPMKWASVTAFVTSSNTNVTSLTLGGLINTATLNGLPALTSLTTSGAINTLTLNNAAVLTGASLGHNAFVGSVGFGGPGSVLTVTNNAKLASLAPTALDWMQTLTVNSNPKLASFDFSSYKTIIFSGAAVAINIDAPAVMGTYAPSIAPVSAGNAAVQAIIHSADINTLKAYIVAALGNVHVTNTSFSINIGVNTTPATLQSEMHTDALSWTTAFGYTNYVFGAPLAGTSVSGVIPAAVTNELSIVQ